jgi:alkaline phosphatase D
MKIAFASCMCVSVFPDQPVWTWIKAQNPDHLVLLGDSIYLDINMPGDHPSLLSDNDFALRLHKLYSDQLAQPQFKDLVQSMPNNRVWSTWDDHDFLWNDAFGAEAAITQSGKVRLSTAFQEVFRKTLAQSLAAGTFPTAVNEGLFWNMAQSPLTTPSIKLANDLWLHLTDGRTNRTRTSFIAESKRQMLGAVQRDKIENVIKNKAKPKDVHLIASGSTLADFKKSYPNDWKWIRGLSSQFRTLVLSGDIHRNEIAEYVNPNGFTLREATSSGVAVKDAVAVGTTRKNFGMLEVDTNKVCVSLYANNKIQTELSRTINRETW